MMKNGFASPLARRIAKEKGIDLAAVRGSGPNGRVIKRDLDDVVGLVANPPAAKATANVVRENSIDPRVFYDPSSFVETPLDSMRKTIAKRLTAAKNEIPHIYLSLDVRLDALLSLRKKINESKKLKISVNDFIVKAMGYALAQVPDANVSFAGDSVLRHKVSDVAVAVAIDGGLITPIVRSVQSKGLIDISTEIKDLIMRARERKLKPQEYEGGTTSVSNLGMFGIESFSAIVNPPQATILAVGKGVEKPVVHPLNKSIEIGTMMNVTLSCDHRVIDGAVGAMLLQVFQEAIEHPSMMIL